MKKIMLLIVLTTILTGCSKEEKENPTTTSTTTESNIIDSSLFVDIDWERDASSDTETIYFSSDNEFGYYCSCGNPVNDSDLCETYSYDNKNEIKINCSEETSETISTIKIKSVTTGTLILEINGEIREFHRSNES